VLVVSNPHLGHLLPLVPLARRLQHVGHQVLFATEPAFGTVVRGYELPHAPIGRDLGLDDLMAALPDIQHIAPEDHDAYARPRVFVALHAHNVLDDLGHVIDDYQPDVVVREDAEFASWALSERAELPQIPVAVGASESARQWEDLAGPWLAELGRRVGIRELDASSLYRHGPLSFAPAGYHDWSDLPGGRTYRPAPSPGGDLREGGDVELGDIGHLRARPLVYATLGTEFFDADVMERVLGAITGIGASAVATTGPGHDPCHLARQFPDVVVRRWVDQHRVLSHATAVVNHGGAGTVIGALCAGVPLVVIPRGADQFAHARRVEQLGAGRVVSADASRSEITDALTTVLADPRFSASARSVARETALLPGVEAAAEFVEHTAHE